MNEEKIDLEIINQKFKIQDLVHNYFKNYKIFDYLEYKIVTDIDEIESLNYEVNTLKEILKELKKLFKEKCRKCQYKILQNINHIRSSTPGLPEHVRRKVAGRKNVRILLNKKKSVSPRMKEIDINEKIGSISSISRDEERISFVSITNNNIIPSKNKKLNRSNINNNRSRLSNANKTTRLSNLNKSNECLINKKKYNNKGLTPNKQLTNKRKNNINKTKYQTISRKSNVSDDEYDKKRILKKEKEKKLNLTHNGKAIKKNNVNRNNNNKIDKKNLTKKNLNIFKDKKAKKMGKEKIKSVENTLIDYLEDYHVEGDYIPRYPDENEIDEDDYFYSEDYKTNKNIDISNYNDIIENNENNINEIYNKEKEKDTIIKNNVNKDIPIKNKDNHKINIIEEKENSNDILNINSSSSIPSAKFNQKNESNSFKNKKEKQINNNENKEEEEEKYILDNIPTPSYYSENDNNSNKNNNNSLNDKNDENKNLEQSFETKEIIKNDNLSNYNNNEINEKKNSNKQMKILNENKDIFLNKNNNERYNNNQNLNNYEEEKIIENYYNNNNNNEKGIEKDIYNNEQYNNKFQETNNQNNYQENIEKDGNNDQVNTNNEEDVIDNNKNIINKGKTILKGRRPKNKNNEIMKNEAYNNKELIKKEENEKFGINY